MDRSDLFRLATHAGPDIPDSALCIVLTLGETASISHQPDDDYQSY
jgi:hypothetical protein